MMTARKTKPTAQLSAGAKLCNLPRSAGSISACPVIRSSCYHPDTRATHGPAGPHACQEAQRASHTMCCLLPEQICSHARIGWRRSHNGGTNMRQYLSKTTLAVIVLAAGVIAAAAQESIKGGVIQPLTGAFAASRNYVAQRATDATSEEKAKSGE